MGHETNINQPWWVYVMLYQQDDIFRGCQWGTKFFNGPSFQGFYPSRLAPCRPSVVNMAMDSSPIDGRFIFVSRVLYFCSRKLRFFPASSRTQPPALIRKLSNCQMLELVLQPVVVSTHPNDMWVNSMTLSKYWQSNLWHHSGCTKRAPHFSC